MTLEKKYFNVAYFSMEFALDANIPNYAGGLGVLAGDMMKSFADLEINGVGVSLLYHQSEDPKLAFDPLPYMQIRKETVKIRIEDREITIGAWQMDLKGEDGHKIPMIFLTTNLPENKSWDRDLTKNLYASGAYNRLCQEAILGIGGVRMLRAMGYDVIKFHLNEGHCSFLTLELLRENNYDIESVKKLCTFTTHTPIEAGHDHFEYKLAYQVLEDELPQNIRELATEKDLSMTHLALNLCGKTNAVSQKHKEVCEKMFPKYEIQGITNGIHHPRWVAKPMAELFDKYLPNWRQNPDIFKQAEKKLPDKEVILAHRKSKRELIRWINAHAQYFCHVGELEGDDFFEPNVMTIVFARRFVSYKRPTLIFKYLEKLSILGQKRLQIIFAGHCHPDDGYCNNAKSEIVEYARNLHEQIRVAIIPEYNMKISPMLVSGADVWLNTPRPPMEASGTSGMKAALNGVLNLSILDGWWIEGYEKNSMSGWAFGRNPYLENDKEACDEVHAHELYDELNKVLACYEAGQEEWEKHMKSAISLISFFNTHRCVKEYQEKMWKK